MFEQEAKNQPVSASPSEIVHGSSLHEGKDLESLVRIVLLTCSPDIQRLILCCFVLFFFDSDSIARGRGCQDSVGMHTPLSQFYVEYGPRRKLFVDCLPLTERGIERLYFQYFKKIAVCPARPSCEFVNDKRMIMTAVVKRDEPSETGDAALLKAVDKRRFDPF